MVEGGRRFCAAGVCGEVRVAEAEVVFSES